MLELVASKDKHAYRAFESARGEARPMLDLRLNDHESWLITYAHLRSSRSHLPEEGDHTLTLFHAVGTATITGRNLGELKDKLAGYAVTWLQLFNPVTHATPEEGQPVITGLDFTEA